MKKSKKALITGITGQDGSYLAELLLEKGYEVHGLIRRSSSFNTERIEHLMPSSREGESPKSIYREYGDLSDSSNISRIIERVRPEEIYNLGAQSHVKISFDTPEYTCDTVGLGTLRLLDAIRSTGKNIKFYQACSSEMFGMVQETPQNEKTPFYPRSPYGCAKCFSYYITRNYRESYNLFACNGILFNHESPRRGGNFVTRKITTGLAKIKLGVLDVLSLGNLEAKRDWGYAKDYVYGMWLMLQQDKPDDYVLATGETHTVREFVEEACRLLGFDLTWKGRGVNEVGIDKKTGKTLIKIDPYFFRPAEVDLLLGDASKAKKRLKWKTEVKFKDLVKIMVEYDLQEQTKKYRKL